MSNLEKSIFALLITTFVYALGYNMAKKEIQNNNAQLTIDLASEIVRNNKIEQQASALNCNIDYSLIDEELDQIDLPY